MDSTVIVSKSELIRGKIVQFEEAIGTLPGAVRGDTDQCPLTHKFADGMYVREIFIPRGQLIVGKIHKHCHPNFLMKGDVSVITESGGVERLKAPQSIISPAGIKRVVYAHEDTVWITVHVTEERDLDKIEEVVIAKTYADLPDHVKKDLNITSDQDCIRTIVDSLNVKEA